GDSPREPAETRSRRCGGASSGAGLLRPSRHDRRARRLCRRARARSSRGPAHSRSALGRGANAWTPSGNAVGLGADGRRESSLANSEAGIQLMCPVPSATASALIRLPLFPLKAVLYPRGHLALRIFEQRYLAMAKSCLTAGTPFGVCLITRGEEVATP